MMSEDMLSAENVVLEVVRMPHHRHIASPSPIGRRASAKRRCAAWGISHYVCKRISAEMSQESWGNVFISCMVTEVPPIMVK